MHPTHFILLTFLGVVTFKCQALQGFLPGPRVGHLEREPGQSLLLFCVICWEAALWLGSVCLQGYGFLHACELLIPLDIMSSNIVLDAGCRTLNVLHRGKGKQSRNT